MNLYIYFSSFNIKCCLNDQKLIYYKKIEKEFKERLSIEMLMSRIMFYDKFASLMLDTEQQISLNSI